MFIPTFNPLVKCAKCETQNTITQGQQKFKCIKCGTECQVSYPPFMDAATNSAFWENQSKVIADSMKSMLGLYGAEQKSTPPFNEKSNNIFQYGSDLPLANVRIKEIEKENNNKFKLSVAEKLEEIKQKAILLFSNNRAEEAYADFFALKQANNNDLFYGFMAGVCRACFFNQPHNDFFELGLELSRSIYNMNFYKSNTKQKYEFIFKSYITPILCMTVNITQKKYDCADEWYINTYLRILFYVESALNLLPSNFYNKSKDKKTILQYINIYDAMVRKIENLSFGKKDNEKHIKQLTKSKTFLDIFSFDLKKK